MTKIARDLANRLGPICDCDFTHDPMAHIDKHAVEVVDVIDTLYADFIPLLQRALLLKFGNGCLKGKIKDFKKYMFLTIVLKGKEVFEKWKCESIRLK